MELLGLIQMLPYAIELSMTNEFTFPNEIPVISKQEMKLFQNLESIHLPSSIKSIEPGSFEQLNLTYSLSFLFIS